MNQLKTIIVCIFCCLWIYPIQGQELPWNGVDVSDLTQVEKGGAVFYDDNSVETPVPNILSNHGVRVARLRLWNNPKDGVNGLDYTLDLAQRLHDAGIDILLCFHFSDSWADPGRQLKPKAWQNLKFNNGLLKTVRDYVRDVTGAFILRGITLVGVQFGNETPSGMLWPDGKVGGDYETEEQWLKLGELFKHAKQGLELAYGGKILPKVVIHLNNGWDQELYKWFFNNLIAQGVDFDVIGVSFYSWWEGTLPDLKENLEMCVKEFGKDIAVVETGYPWTLEWYDMEQNFVGLKEQLDEGYPATRTGQADFLLAVKIVVAGLPDNRGLGVIYFSATSVTSPGLESRWENVALVDSSGQPNPALDVLKTAL